jgi:hypothetical protein
VDTEDSGEADADWNLKPESSYVKNDDDLGPI